MNLQHRNEEYSTCPKCGTKVYDSEIACSGCKYDWLDEETDPNEEFADYEEEQYDMYERQYDYSEDPASHIDEYGY